MSNKITASSEIDLGSFTDAPEGKWFPSLIEQQNEINRQVVSYIGSNLPLLNSPMSQIGAALQMVHNIPLTIKNPLSVPIRAVTAVACLGLTLDSSGKPTRSIYYLGLPDIEWHPSGKQDGSVVATANFPSPVGICAVKNSANQLISQNVSTAIAMDVEDFKGGALTHSTTSNNSRITCAVAGIVRAEYMGTFQASVAAGQRYFWISKNGNTGDRWGVERPQAQLNTNPFQVSGTGLISVAAGDYVELYFNQDFAAGANVLGGGADCCKLSAQYTSPPLTTTGAVKLLFAGGE